MADYGDLPLFIDTEEESVWDDWGVTFRDVIIVDGDNQQVAVFNLTTHDLEELENRNSLKALLLDAAD